MAIYAQRMLICGLLCFWFGLGGQFDAYAQSSPKIPTPLTIAISDQYPPFMVLAPNGEPSGLLVEMWRLWSKTTNTSIRFHASDWPGTLDSLQNGQADIHSGLFRSESRAKWNAFSDPIHEIKTGLFFKTNDLSPRPLQAMGGRTVGAIGGFYQLDYLRENYPDIRTKAYPDGQALVLGLLNTEVDAILNEIPAVEADVARFALRGSVTHGDEIAFSNLLFAGIKKGNRDLMELINSGFESIPIKDLTRLEDLWLPDPDSHFYLSPEAGPQLAPQEERWLARHPVIRM